MSSDQLLPTFEELSHGYPANGRLYQNVSELGGLDAEDVPEERHPYRRRRNSGPLPHLWDALPDVSREDPGPEYTSDFTINVGEEESPTAASGTRPPLLLKLVLHRHPLSLCPEPSTALLGHAAGIRGSESEAADDGQSSSANNSENADDAEDTAQVVVPDGDSHGEPLPAESQRSSSETQDTASTTQASSSSSSRPRQRQRRRRGQVPPSNSTVKDHKRADMIWEHGAENPNGPCRRCVRAQVRCMVSEGRKVCAQCTVSKGSRLDCNVLTPEERTAEERRKRENDRRREERERLKRSEQAKDHEEQENEEPPETEGKPAGEVQKQKPGVPSEIDEEIETRDGDGVEPDEEHHHVWTHDEELPFDPQHSSVM